MFRYRGDFPGYPRDKDYKQKNDLKFVAAICRTAFGRILWKERWKELISECECEDQYGNSRLNHLGCSHGNYHEWNPDRYRDSCPPHGNPYSSFPELLEDGESFLHLHDTEEFSYKRAEWTSLESEILKFCEDHPDGVRIQERIETHIQEIDSSKWDPSHLTPEIVFSVYNELVNNYIQKYSWDERNRLEKSLAEFLTTEQIDALTEKGLIEPMNFVC